MTSGRVFRFVTVGAAGFVVQMAVGAALLAAGLHAGARDAAGHRGRHREQPCLAPPMGLARSRPQSTVATHAAACACRQRWHVARRGDGHGARAVGTRACPGRAGGCGGAVRGRQLRAGRSLGVRARRWRRRAHRPSLPCRSRRRPSASASGPSPQALQSWDRYVAALERARAADLVARRARPGPPTTIRSGTRVLAALERGELDISRRELRRRCRRRRHARTLAGQRAC